MGLTNNQWNALSAGLSAGGGLFSGIANIISQFMANKANMQAARENNELQRELAEYQWSKNLEMWNLQNQYNSPLSQMQRFKAAGLNPNLIYSQGNAGNASSMPSYQSPTTQAVTRNAVKFGNFNMALDLLSKYQSIRIGQQQERNMESARNLTEIDRLVKFEKNMRDWQLHRYNQDIKGALLQQIRANATKLVEDAEYRHRENQFWKTYGFSPNSRFGMFAGLANTLSSLFSGGRWSISDWIKSTQHVR